MRYLTTILMSFTLLSGQNLFPILGGQRVGTSSYTFLKIGVSARAVGMGEAVVALNQDAGSVYYNPGTISQLAKTEIAASHIDWPANVKYDFISLVRQVSKRGHIGLMSGILHMAPMEETTEYRPHGTGQYFTYQDRFVGLTYGIRMTDRFSFGVTAKHVSENLAGVSMSTVLIDMGTFYWTGYRSLRFSAALNHFGPQTAPDGSYWKHFLNQDTGEETVIKTAYNGFSPPTIFQVGAAMNIIEDKTQTLTLATQLNHPVDNAEYIVSGMEYSFNNILFLRAGYKSNKLEENVSFGAGLVIPLKGYSLHVDYAYTNFVHLSDPVRFSLGVSF